MPVLLLLVILVFPSFARAEPTAGELVRKGLEYWRGTTSVAEIVMTIHRPDWERSMTLKGWTRGRSDSLFTILAPPRDRGNGTLKKNRDMWTYNPKINRTIKIPPSMMAQSWMGSDFSNNDLAKSDSVLEDYTHELQAVDIRDGVRVYTVSAVPRPEAPVVWGRQELVVREDFIILEQRFYDEDGVAVKILTGSDLQIMDGRLFPRVWVMRKTEVQDEYTRMEYTSLHFGPDLPDRLFTLNALSEVAR